MPDIASAFLMEKFALQSVRARIVWTLIPKNTRLKASRIQGKKLDANVPKVSALKIIVNAFKRAKYVRRSVNAKIA